jgi:hypothetical protein
MGKSDPQAGIYTDKLKALQQEIIKLNELVHQEQVAHIRDQLQVQLQDITKIQTLVRQKAPLTQAEWQQRSDTLNTYATLLDLRQKLLDSLKSQNEAPSPDDIKFLNDGKAEIDAARKSLEDGRQQITVVEINSQFQQLTKKRAQMIDAYSRFFGTNKERAALQDLISVLDQIVANRERAAAAGNKTATSQIVQYRAEAEKFKRK